MANTREPRMNSGEEVMGAGAGIAQGVPKAAQPDQRVQEIARLLYGVEYPITKRDLLRRIGSKKIEGMDQSIDDLLTESETEEFESAGHALTEVARGLQAGSKGSSPTP